MQVGSKDVMYEAMMFKGDARLSWITVERRLVLWAAASLVFLEPDWNILDRLLREGETMPGCAILESTPVADIGKSRGSIQVYARRTCFTLT